MYCRTSIAIKLASCEAEYRLMGFDPNQPYTLHFACSGVHISKEMLSDGAGVITLNEADFPEGWFSAYRFINVEVKQGDQRMFFKKGEVLHTIVTMAMTSYVENTINETKIEGEWVYL